MSRNSSKWTLSSTLRRNDRLIPDIRTAANRHLSLPALALTVAGLIAGGIAMTGCISSSRGGGCLAGSVAPCQCTDGTQSTRTCGVDGFFDTCQCGEATRGCGAGGSDGCVCPDGTVGIRICDDSGIQSGCACPFSLSDAGYGSTADGAGLVDAEPPSIEVLDWVIIEDTSNEENTHGTPGADVCGVSFVCPGGIQGVGLESRFIVRGWGDICAEEMSDCLASRDLPEAALGPPEIPCEAASAPSHFVSIGVQGILAVRMGVTGDDRTLIDQGGLVDCDVSVVELAGGSVFESYQVRVCTDAEPNDCAEWVEEVPPRPGDSRTDVHTFTVR